MTKNLTFNLRKPIRRLEEFCEVFNDLPANCDLQLQDIRENDEVFSYISISFEIPGVYSLVFNRDLVGKITGDDLLAINNFRSFWSERKNSFGEHFSFSAKDTDVLCVGSEHINPNKFSYYVGLRSVPQMKEQQVFNFNIKLKSGSCSQQYLLDCLMGLANTLLMDNGMISIAPSASIDDPVLIVSVFLCHPQRPSMQLYLNMDNSPALRILLGSFITKINLASHYGCPILLSCKDDFLNISVYASSDEKKLAELNRQLKLLNL